MKEVRTISMYDVRKACISYDLYTAGDCEEYDRMLMYVREIERATTDELETIAKDIKEHSDTDKDVKEIMFILANECCTTFFDD